MKKDKICVRAFVNGNLGDDLFIYILCNRYPHEQFVVCGLSKYSGSFAEIKNLTYKSVDSPGIKWGIRCINFMPILLNYICKKFWKRELFSKLSLFDILSRTSRYNILISGSLFMQKKSSGKLYFKNIKSPYMRCEKKYYSRSPIVMGCNFGPFYDEGYLKEYQALFSGARQVSFRDKYSAELFFGDNIFGASDIVFSYPKDKCVLPNIQNYILVSVVNLHKDFDEKANMSDRYLEYLNNLIQVLLENNQKVILLGCCKAQGDDKVCKQIMEQLKDKQANVGIINYPDMDMNQVAGYFANAKYVIASRFHAMILGWLFEKNVFPIIYDDKMLHVIDDIQEKAGNGKNIKYTSIYDLDTNSIEYILKHMNDSFEWSEELGNIVIDSGRHFQLLDDELK